ncbi:ABC transporter permease [Microbacterium halotolerans]|uniref:ABC transporter permease n=1 Tax=Microbacterium halotolerans TaxID=246613 RepID=UPI000E6AC9A2|nr:ABC transporter permease [Microbacterium halotolerans]
MSAVETSSRLSSAASRRARLTWPAWTWSALGVIVVWASILVLNPGPLFDPLSQALTLAPFLALVSVGQMLVITLGPGNIDVSVGAIISMAAYVSVAIGSESGIVLGLVAAVASGLAAALISVVAILVLRVPPIIATLATSLIIASVVLVLADANRGGSIAGLREFINVRVLGVPTIALVVLGATLIVAFLLRRTMFGRSVIAIGQSDKAASKAGIRVKLVSGSVYLLSGAVAGLTGGILAALIAPSTVLGTSYMLDSIAVVVIGGTLIAGGRPVVTGVWTGALFFVMLSGLLNLAGWSLGQQNVLKGLLVVLVVIVSSGVTGTGATTLRRLTRMFTRHTSQKAGTVHG